MLIDDDWPIRLNLNHPESFTHLPGEESTFHYLHSHYTHLHSLPLPSIASFLPLPVNRKHVTQVLETHAFFLGQNSLPHGIQWHLMHTLGNHSGEDCEYIGDDGRLQQPLWVYGRVCQVEPDGCHDGDCA